MSKLFPFRSRSTVNLGLHNGAASGNLGLVKFALDNGQAIDSVVNGLLPIHAACAGGHTLVVKYLIERGADVNARRRPRRLSGSLLTSRASDELGSSALHFAAANGNVDLIHLLLVNGAQANVVDKYGSTPLSVALAKHNMGAVTLLQQHILTNHSTPTLTITIPLSYPKQVIRSRSRSTPILDKTLAQKEDYKLDENSLCSSGSASEPNSQLDIPVEPTLFSSPPVEKPKPFHNFFCSYSKIKSSSTISSCCNTCSLTSSLPSPPT